MGLNMKKLRDMQKEIKSKSEGGGGLFLYSSELPEELDVRILPPKANMNGVYFLEEEGWWVNGQFVLVGSNDVVKDEIDKAKKSKDEDLIALINRKNKGIPAIKRQIRYMLPILVLDTEYDEDTDEMTKCEVDGQKILVAKPTLMREINRIVTARPFQNGTDFGVADRVKGNNIIVGKQGKGLDTEYMAMGWNESTEMNAKWYENLPDILETHEKAKSSPERQRSLIRNYLYGDEIIEDSKSGDSAGSSDDDAAEEKPKRKRSKLKKKDPKEEEEEEPKKDVAGESEESKAQPEKSKKVRSILEDAAGDLDDMD